MCDCSCNQPDSREGQVGRNRVAERLVVSEKSGNVPSIGTRVQTVPGTKTARVASARQIHLNGGYNYIDNYNHRLCQ